MMYFKFSSSEYRAVSQTRFPQFLLVLLGLCLLSKRRTDAIRRALDAEKGAWHSKGGGLELKLKGMLGILYINLAGNYIIYK